MQRRRFLTLAASTPVVSVGTAGSASASNPSNIEAISKDFFDSFREVDETDRREVLVECADTLCLQTQVPDETTRELVESNDAIRHQLRRIRFGIEILNELDLTTAIKPGMIQNVEKVSRKATRYMPLIGSFNHLQLTACDVGEDPTEDEIEAFLYALLAFGLEVGLWQMNVPFRMAWSGTRFVSNRTFLRVAKQGCNRCIALAMSELHWALRNIPYMVVTDDKFEFVVTKVESLRDYNAKIEGYNATLSVDEAMIRRQLELPERSAPGMFVRRQDRGFFDRLFDKLSLPEIWSPLAVATVITFKERG